MSTFGPAYEAKLDHRRIMKQMERIQRLMFDGEWRTLGEIAEITDDPESSISAQLRHLRKPRFGMYDVQKRRRTDNGGTWEYRVLPGSGEIEAA